MPFGAPEDLCVLLGNSRASMGLSESPRPLCVLPGQGRLHNVSSVVFFWFLLVFFLETGLLVLRRLSQQPRSRVRLRFWVRVGKRQSLELALMWFGKWAAKGCVRLHGGSSPNSFSPRLKLIQGQSLGLAQ